MARRPPMPHKRNPVASVLAVASARQAQARGSVLIGSLDQEHERAFGAWHAEWPALVGALAYSGGAVDAARRAVTGLDVHEDQMRANLEASGLGSSVGSAETLVDRALAAYGGKSDDARAPVAFIAQDDGGAVGRQRGLVGDLSAPSLHAAGTPVGRRVGTAPAGARRRRGSRPVLRLRPLARRRHRDVGGERARAHRPPRAGTCTSARFGEPKLWRDRAALVGEQGPRSPTSPTRSSRWFTPRERADVVDRFRRMLLETPREAYAACCPKRSPHGISATAWGRSDADARDRRRAGSGDAAGPRARGGIPDAQLAVIPDASHLANVGRPRSSPGWLPDILRPWRSDERSTRGWDADSA